eukprot:4890602-Amphidinium_carterae.1
MRVLVLRISAVLAATREESKGLYIGPEVGRQVTVSDGRVGLKQACGKAGVLPGEYCEPKMGAVGSQASFCLTHAVQAALY